MSSYLMPSCAPMSARGSIRSSVQTVAASILTALGLAVATPASAQTVIHACYVPASGTVYRIKATSTPQNCLQPTHVAFSWTDGAEAVAALQSAVKNTDNAAGDVTGVFSNLTVGKLLGRALAATPPTDGQVLSWNAGTQQWEAKTVAAGGGGGGVSDHGALTGLGDDDHIDYLRKNTDRSTPSFAVSYPISSESPVLANTGSTRGAFLAIPSKGAIRAGITSDATQWTNSNIGRASASFGEANVAKGARSFAAGHEAIAEGDASLALGWRVKATGFASFAAGQDALASGQSAFAFGNGAVASGTVSVALGGGEASGVGSVVLADGKASALASFAMAGQADGFRGIAIGHRAHTNGKSDAVVIAAGDPDLGFIRAASHGQFVVSAPSIFLGYQATPTATAGRFIETGPGAYLSSGGVWTNVSDSTKKSNFRAVDNESVLSKLAAMPIYTWQYTAEDSTTRHMGPTAQAFRAAFGLGDTDKAISTVDIDGVAVAGVKALEARTRTLKTEVTVLRQENAELAARLAQLEALMAQLSGNSAPRNR